jgi:WD40 repeat protein
VEVSWSSDAPSTTAAATHSTNSLTNTRSRGGSASKAAAFSSASAFASVADRWLHTEPVTCAVDKSSDRPLYCIAVNERTHSFVAGGADHSLRVYDSGTASMRRELYSKTSGHSEWVTTCAYLPDGRVLSGGMDAKIVLWESTGTRAQNLLGHTASVTKVMADDREIGLSASYDRSLRVWSLAARTTHRELAVLKGSAGAITACDWHNSLALSGTREGQIGVWDINSGTRLRWLAPAGNGQILTLQLGSVEAGVAASEDATRAIPLISMHSSYEWLVAAGGADGFLRLYDLRSSSCILQRRLSEGNPGSVNDVAFAPGKLVVALADGVCKVVDARGGWRTSAVLRGHRSPVSAVKVPPECDGAVAVSSGSNGWVTVHDLRKADGNESDPVITIDAAYAMGLTTAGGINALWAGADRVIAAGDDGQPVILNL